MEYIYKDVKRKPRFFVLSLKNIILPATFCIFTICLVAFSNTNLLASKSGLMLWANNVIPSLLPFFIATELLSYTNVVTTLGRLLNPIMKPIFNVPGVGSYALIMGIISGYPTGAKIVTDLREKGLCTKEEGERLLAFTNNSGPLFIIGTIGITLFGNTLIGVLLLITHILASLTVGFLFRFWKNDKKVNNDKDVKYDSSTKKDVEVSFSNLGEVLSKSILSSVKTIVLIGGFIVLFSVIISILEQTNVLEIIGDFFYPLFKLFGINDFSFCKSFISGIIELTNGALQIANITSKNISTNIILISAILGFGGFSVLLQVFSITSKSDVSIKAYFIGKVLQGIIAATYTFLFIYSFPIFNLNL